MAFDYPPTAIEILPDRPRQRRRFRFKVMSSSGNGTYVISYDSAPATGWWACSCPSCTYRGHCKHLESAGLRGRRFGASPMPLEEMKSSKAHSRKEANSSEPKFSVLKQPSSRQTKAEVIAFLKTAPQEVLDALRTM